MKIFSQSVFQHWPIEDKSVQAVITSPPYYALRKYDIPDVVIGGDKNCKHEFEMKDMELGSENRQGKGSKTLNAAVTSHIGVHGKKVGKQGFCIHCNAWQGQHGLEPDHKLYVEHTRLWASEAWRVLRDNGIMFLNLGDSYSGSNCGSNDYTTTNRSKPEAYREMYKGQKVGKQNIKSKCQLLIPHRVAMVLIDDGWILRNTIIWYKPNAMPESVTDRFSKRYEYVFMFVKQQKYYFNLDAVREEHAEATKQRVKYPTGMIQKYKDNDIGQTKGTFGHILKNGKNPGDVWSINTQASSEKHFAMWPEKLVERMILSSTKAGDIVLDCFCGSATTLRVADMLNRVGQGIDLGYSEIQSRRLTEIQKELIYK